MEQLELTRVKWDLTYRPAIGAKPISTLRSFIYHSQGMRFFYDRALESNCVQKELVKVGGGLAEGFKSFFSLRVSREFGDDLTLEQAVNSLFLPAAKYVKDEVVEDLKKELRSCFSHLSEKYSLSYRSVMDFFYVLSRNRYFIGVGEFPNSTIRPKIHALYSEALVAAAMRISDKERADGLLHYKLIERLYSDLLYFPFANKGWSKEVLGLSSDSVNLYGKGLRHTSPKLYGEIPVKKCRITSVIPADQRNHEEVVKIDKSWRSKQKSLGRNWMWCHFDNIYSVAKRSFEEDGVNSCYLKESMLRELFHKKYFEFENSNDVRMVIKLLVYQLFQGRAEVSSKVES